MIDPSKKNDGFSIPSIEYRITHGIVAVTPDTDEVLHFVGMAHIPTDEDFFRVQETLDNLNILDEDYELREATEIEVSKINRRFKVEGDQIYYVN